MTAESSVQRGRRRRQRVLFDEVADLYAATRSGYPGEIVDFAGLTEADSVNGSGLFEPAVSATHERRTTMSASAVVGIENTRATALSWPAEEREEFTAQLRELLAGCAEVQLTQETSLTMARCLG
jgi:hypothetical protein